MYLCISSIGLNDFADGGCRLDAFPLLQPIVFSAASDLFIGFISS